MLAIFAGQEARGNFRKTVLRILREHLDVLEISKGRVLSKSADNAILVVFERQPHLLHSPKSAVFLNQCRSNAKISAERYLICNSANYDDLELARKSGGEVITCGMSLRDSVTFSSFTEDRCVISVQRRLTRFDGSKAEPFELPVCCLKDDHRYGILCANLLLILLGYL